MAQTSTMKTWRFSWSTTTSSARSPFPRSLSSSRLSTTWRPTARKPLIWSSTALSVRDRATSWSLWTSTCPSVTVSGRRRWSATTWRSRTLLQLQVWLHSLTSASWQLNSRRFRRWHRSLQLSMSIRCSQNLFSRRESNNYFYDQVYSLIE